VDAKGALIYADETQIDAEKIKSNRRFFVFYPRFSALSPQESARLLFVSQTKGEEEGGDDVKSAWPFDALGDTRATMAITEGCEAARWS
jgi:hypothetical protein